MISLEGYALPLSYTRTPLEHTSRRYPTRHITAPAIRHCSHSTVLATHSLIRISLKWGV